MAAQSMIMGDSFGKAYQYGKRKISAMSNEEFNKLDTKQLGQEILTDYRNIIPSVSQAIEESNKFQSLIVNQLAQILRDLPADLIGGVTNNQELVDKLKANAKANQEGAGDIILALLKQIESALPLDPLPQSFQTLATVEDSRINQEDDPNKFQAPTSEHLARVAEQKIEDARVKRLQELLFAKARAQERKTQRTITPAPHIIDRSRSNVSMQSLRIEKSRLLANVNNAKATRTASLRNRALIGQQRINRLKRLAEAIATARQQLANFMKMHGKRF